MRHATLRFQLVKIEIRVGIFFLIFHDACLVKIIKTLTPKTSLAIEIR